MNFEINLLYFFDGLTRAIILMTEMWYKDVEFINFVPIHSILFFEFVIVVSYNSYWLYTEHVVFQHRQRTISDLIYSRTLYLTWTEIIEPASSHFHSRYCRYHHGGGSQTQAYYLIRKKYRVYLCRGHGRVYTYVYVMDNIFFKCMFFSHKLSGVAARLNCITRICYHKISELPPTLEAKKEWKKSLVVIKPLVFALGLSIFLHVSFGVNNREFIYLKKLTFLLFSAL